MKKRNEEPKLYKKFVDSQKKEEMPKAHEEVNMKELIENRKREEKEAKIEIRKKKMDEKRKKKYEKHFKITVNEKMTIAVCTLTNKNVGCTYLCKALALCFLNRGKSVCIINYRNVLIEESICDEYKTKKEMIDSGEDYNVIIYNIGNLEENEPAVVEAKLATKRIMMCLCEESFIRKLSSKVEEESFKEWKYIFSFVPESQYKEIDALMEDYQYECLPLYALSKKEVDKIVWKCLK